MRKKIRNPKERKRKRRHMHIRHTVVGTAERPRVCVFRSKSHIYAQIIDDEHGRTLATVSSLKLDRQPTTPPPVVEAAPDESQGGPKKTKGGKKGGKKGAAAEGAGVLQAKEVGRRVAEVAREKGITRIRFDRGGYLYHGRVAALAQAMREGGLEF